MMTIREYLLEALVVIAALLFYFLPTLVATHRNHHQYLAIFALNLLLGWTGVGWIVALIWSLAAVDKKQAEEWADEWAERRSRARWRRGRR